METTTETEILVIKTQLKNIFIPSFIELLCYLGYRETGNKFSISYHGSKGYLNNLSIECEGIQKANNKILRDEIFTKKRSVRKTLINIFHSEAEGIRLSLGKDEPRKIKISQPEAGAFNKEPVPIDEEHDDLPF
tara:strand:- start:47 stop:448 length:402 start_codon:yes stop_codon:yes gene_type:complete